MIALLLAILVVDAPVLAKVILADKPYALVWVVRRGGFTPDQQFVRRYSESLPAYLALARASAVMCKPIQPKYPCVASIFVEVVRTTDDRKAKR